MKNEFPFDRTSDVPTQQLSPLYVAGDKPEAIYTVPPHVGAIVRVPRNMRVQFYDPKP